MQQAIEIEALYRSFRIFFEDLGFQESIPESLPVDLTRKTSQILPRIGQAVFASWLLFFSGSQDSAEFALFQLSLRVKLGRDL